MAKADQDDRARSSKKVPASPRPDSPMTSMVLRSACKGHGESSGSERSDSRMTTRSSHSATDTQQSVDHIQSEHHRSCTGHHHHHLLTEIGSEVVVESERNVEIVLSASPALEADTPLSVSTRVWNEAGLTSVDAENVMVNRHLRERRVKTDYTYSHSYHALPPTPVEPPNMSRFELRSVERSLRLGNGQLGTALENQVVNGSGMSLLGDDQNAWYAAAFNEKYRLEASMNGSHVGAGIGNVVFTKETFYGLDSDSDDEGHCRTDASGQIRPSRRQSHSFNSRSMNLRRVCGLVSQKLSDAWLVLMQKAYWIFAYALLLETWLLVRDKRSTRSSQSSVKFWPFLLPLLLLLIGCYCYKNFVSEDLLAESLSSVPVLASVFEDSVESKAATRSGFDFSGSVIGFAGLLGGFLSNTGASMLYYVTPARQVATEKVLVSETTYNERDNIAVAGKLVASGSSVDQSEMQALVKKLVQQEVDTLSTRLIADSRHHASKQWTTLDVRLAAMRDEMSLNTGNVLNLKEDVAFLKAELHKQREAAKEDVTGPRFQKLEEIVLGLEDKLNHLQLDLGSLRNCCRNHTEYGMFVEDHVISVLNKLSDKDSDPSLFLGFRQWLQSLQDKTSHVEQQDIDAWAKKISTIIIKDIHSDVESIAKSAAGQVTTEHRSISLDTSESVVKAIVNDVLALYSADKIGKTDFALESSGGSVISTRCSETYYLKTAQLSILGFPLWYTSNTARIVIQPSVYPGECWAFKGSAGYVVVQLSMPVRVTGFTLEHIPRSLAPRGKIDSAPKEFEVFGLLNEQDPEPKVLGKYVYDQDGEPLQQFAVTEHHDSAFPIVELRVLSNHGNPDYTCIYRFRVHGVLRA